MAKSSGNIRNAPPPPISVDVVKRGLMQYAKEDRWNDNTSYRMGFNANAQAVIDDVATGNDFAAQVAQSVKARNYSISEKQAYVIAKAAVDKKSRFLYKSKTELAPIFSNDMKYMSNKERLRIAKAKNEANGIKSLSKK